MTTKNPRGAEPRRHRRTTSQSQHVSSPHPTSARITRISQGDCQTALISSQARNARNVSNVRANATGRMSPSRRMGNHYTLPHISRAKKPDGPVERQRLETRRAPMVAAFLPPSFAGPERRRRTRALTAAGRPSAVWHNIRAGIRPPPSSRTRRLCCGTSALHRPAPCRTTARPARRVIRAHQSTEQIKRPRARGRCEMA